MRTNRDFDDIMQAYELKMFLECGIVPNGNTAYYKMFEDSETCARLRRYLKANQTEKVVK